MTTFANHHVVLDGALYELVGWSDLLGTAWPRAFFDPASTFHLAPCSGDMGCPWGVQMVFSLDHADRLTLRDLDLALPGPEDPMRALEPALFTRPAYLNAYNAHPAYPPPLCGVTPLRAERGFIARYEGLHYPLPLDVDLLLGADADWAECFDLVLTPYACHTLREVMVRGGRVVAVHDRSHAMRAVRERARRTGDRDPRSLRADILSRLAAEYVW